MDDFHDAAGAFFAICLVYIALALGVSTWMQSHLDDQASEWADISDARQCTDYRGMRNEKLVFACLGGKEYEVDPIVVERAQQMKKGATP